MKIDAIKAKELAEAGDIDALREGGSVEVYDATIEGVHLVARMDFRLMRKAYAALIDMKIDGNGAQAELDIIGAGDKVLQFGAVLGGEEITSKSRTRFIACQHLGAWVANIATESEAESKKK
ncbi:MAG: hypothetical protein SNF86_06700 [Rikenellaceae bacterium]